MAPAPSNTDAHYDVVVIGSPDAVSEALRQAVMGIDG